MTYQIPTQVTEVKLIYRNRVLGKNRPQIKSSHDAYKIFSSTWDEDTISLYEEFYILLLDRANCVMAKMLVSQGGTTGTVVDPKIVFAAALKGRAASIIMAHNHPSGRLVPSNADKKLTIKLSKAGEFLDLLVLDHLILSPDGGYYSFANEGEL